MSASRGCLIFTNLLTFLASIIIVASALLIRFYGQTKCSGYVQGPILVIGIVLFVVSLIGMIGSCCRLTSVLCVYLCVMLFVVIGLLSFTLVAIAVLPMSNQKDASSEGLSPLQEHSYLLRNNLIINFLIGCCAFRSSVIADQRYRDYS